MSPFIIFAIILTLAYLLYYVTNILVDIKAKPKQNEEEGQSIAVGDAQEDKDDFTPPKAVVENTMTGGFEFVNPENKIEEAPAEAVEPTQSPMEHEEENCRPETTEPSEASQPQSNEKQSESVTEDPNEAVQEPEDVSEPEVEEEEVPGVTKVDFSDAPQAEEPSEPFDETDAFDPDLALPQYGVTAVVGEKKDTEAGRIVSTVNDKLISAPYRIGCLMTETELKEDVQKNSNTNIEHTDEATHY